MRVGITGHQRLARPGGWGWVSTQIDLVLSQATNPLVGVTCLAIGADQLFAERVLYHGGALYVVVPFEGYDATFHSASDRDAYLRLLLAASYKKLLLGCGSAEESYMKAGKTVVEVSDLVVAVWDGEPAAGPGGTADIVGFAIERRKPLIHLNPVLETTQRHPA